MASSYKPSHSQNPWFGWLVLIWTVLGFTVSESVHKIPLSGVIGGNVTFRCPVDKEKTITFLYLQRGDTFVNGYYMNEDLPNNVWKNTRVDRKDTAVHMFGLNISHIGVYQFYIQYSGDRAPTKIVIDLSVTAPYSRPTFTTACMEENHSRLCTVTCASHGGYPQTEMRFEVNASGNSSRQMWTVVSNPSSKDPDTMTYNSSSTARFNCSNREVDHIRCSVGEASSELFSVCQQLPPTTNNLVAIIAVAVCSVLAVVIVVLLWRRRCKQEQCCRRNRAQRIQPYRGAIKVLNVS